MSVGVATVESDDRLIERVAGGDREAFTELYRRFARPVLAMALRALGDNGRAEDAALRRPGRLRRHCACFAKTSY